PASAGGRLSGARGDPYAALADLGRRITGSPGDLLHQVVRAVADALRAPYAAVILAGEQAPTAYVGHRAGPEIEAPLTLRGRQAGSLIVAQPPPPRNPRTRTPARATSCSFTTSPSPPPPPPTPRH